MALATRISSRATRRAVEAEGRRFDEIGAAKDIGTTYQAVDRAGDLLVQTKFLELYRLVDSQDEKDAIARAYVTWMNAERREDYAVQAAVTDAVTLMKENNEFFLGTFVPADSDGAA